jgi:hypothetical protein
LVNLLRTFAFAVLLVPTAAQAYNCRRAESIGDAVDGGHPLVFKGRVLHASAPVRGARFEVLQVYHGAASGEVSIHFSDSYDMRPFAFRVGETWLVSVSATEVSTSAPVEGFPKGFDYAAVVCNLRKRVATSPRR